VKHKYDDIMIDGSKLSMNKLPFPQANYHSAK